MSDEENVKHIRPPGEVIAELSQPALRFGVALSLAVRAYDGIVYVARAGGAGNLEWVEHNPATYVHPLIHMDEEIAQAMLRALNDQPIRSRGDYALDHLEDAKKVRDDMFAQYIRLQEQHFSLLHDILGKVK